MSDAYAKRIRQRIGGIFLALLIILTACGAPARYDVVEDPPPFEEKPWEVECLTVEYIHQGESWDPDRVLLGEFCKVEE